MALLVRHMTSLSVTLSERVLESPKSCALLDFLSLLFSLEFLYLEQPLEPQTSCARAVTLRTQTNNLSQRISLRIHSCNNRQFFFKVNNWTLVSINYYILVDIRRVLQGRSGTYLAPLLEGRVRSDHGLTMMG